MWQNSKTQIETKLNNSNCHKTQKHTLWQNSKTQIVTKLKTSNCEKTQELKWWEKQIKKKNDKTQILSLFFFLFLWKNLKTPFVTKLKKK